MPLRNDASLAAAELALFVEKAALGTGAGVIAAVLTCPGAAPSNAGWLSAIGGSR